jgi:hypothetical protein
MKKTATETLSLQWRMWQSYLKHTYEITSEDASRHGRILLSGVWLPIITLKVITCRYSTLNYKELFKDGVVI